MANEAQVAPAVSDTLSLGTSHFKEANERVHEALDTYDTLVLENVYAQRYLGCAMPSGKTLLIHGTPGNDMASYMDGGSIEVFGNAQDQVGNTMNDGKIIIHGRCGDAAGYAMRGGRILVRDDCGWRVGIHMKQYEQKCPMVVIGGNAGNFLGEYLAGGIIVLLGHAGEYLATGMHGGVIYLKHRLDEKDVLPGLMQEPVDDIDCKVLVPLLEEYNRCFSGDLGAAIDASGQDFWKLRPASSRPYAAMYAN
jgi:glutamate synthase domain-containing protein 3